LTTVVFCWPGILVASPVKRTGAVAEQDVTPGHAGCPVSCGCIHVIASAAKQSILFFMPRHGLLRCASNDGEMATHTPLSSPRRRGSSTQRLLGSINTVSGILDRPPSRTMTTEYDVTFSRHESAACPPSRHVLDAGNARTRATAPARSLRDSASAHRADCRGRSGGPAFPAEPASPARCRSCRAVHVRCPCDNRYRSCLR
jgi:hypothetical protein